MRRADIAVIYVAALDGGRRYGYCRRIVFNLKNILIGGNGEVLARRFYHGKAYL